MKIEGQIEQIFAHAVALDQSGLFRNSIYAQDREVFILNYDHTVLLRFRLRSSEFPFAHPIYFKANDYDSNQIYEEDGKVVFVTEQEGFQRKKSCGLAEYEPSDIHQLFNEYLSSKAESQEVILSKAVTTLLETDLSHIEFSGEKGGFLKMIQRNIYSGGIIEIQEKKDTKALKDEKGESMQIKLTADFGPVGIKTNDFVSLFAFQDVLKFQFPSGEQGDFILVRSVDREKRDMVGIIACCLYDEIMEIREAGATTKRKETNNGRQEQKIRRSK